MPWLAAAASRQHARVARPTAPQRQLVPHCLPRLAAAALCPQGLVADLAARLAAAMAAYQKVCCLTAPVAARRQPRSMFRPSVVGSMCGLLMVARAGGLLALSMLAAVLVGACLHGALGARPGASATGHASIKVLRFVRHDKLVITCPLGTGVRRSWCARVASRCVSSSREGTGAP